MAILESICRELEEGRAVALASVVEQSASSPRHAGASMVVGLDGLIDGTVGGGLLEAEAIKAARQIAIHGGATFQRVELTSTDATRSDMICGGSMRLYIEAIAATPENLAFFDALRREVGLGFDMLTVTPSEHPESRLHCRRHEEPATVPAWTRQAVQAFEQSGGALPLVATTDTGSVVVQVWRCPSVLILAGGGHVSLETARVASLAGFTVSVIDDREEFSNPQRFPAAAGTYVAPEFADCFANFYVTERTFIAIMTRGHLYDRYALKQALETKAGYIGMIGSSRKTAMVFDALLKEGVSTHDIERVTAPIGLSIGAETPGEIAVSIVAQLIATRARATGGARHLDERLAGK